MGSFTDITSRVRLPWQFEDSAVKEEWQTCEAIGNRLLLQFEDDADSVKEEL